MARIPKAKKANKSKIVNLQIEDNYLERCILFSFDTIDKNEYFNLDGTCQNWAAELFDTMRIVSTIPSKDIYAGMYSKKGSSLRIHTHENAKAPCKTPENIDLKEMWQIRISASKGGIHGILCKNIFYVIWFDPQHNLYPDENYGGLKKVIPPSTCCKDRDMEIKALESKLEKAIANAEFWEEYAQDVENKKEKL